jgi:hypothetical protein
MPAIPEEPYLPQIRHVAAAPVKTELTQTRVRLRKLTNSGLVGTAGKLKTLVGAAGSFVVVVIAGATKVSSSSSSASNSASSLSKSSCQKSHNKPTIFRPVLIKTLTSSNISVPGLDMTSAI